MNTKKRFEAYPRTSELGNFLKIGDRALLVNGLCASGKVTISTLAGDVQ